MIEAAVINKRRQMVPSIAPWQFAVRRDKIEEELGWGAPTHPHGRLDANMIAWGMRYLAYWKSMRRGAG